MSRARKLICGPNDFLMNHAKSEARLKTEKQPMQTIKITIKPNQKQQFTCLEANKLRI